MKKETNGNDREQKESRPQLWLVSALIWFALALFTAFTDRESSMWVTWLCFGSSSLCFYSAAVNRQAAEKKEDTAEQQNEAADAQRSEKE